MWLSAFKQIHSWCLLKRTPSIKTTPLKAYSRAQILSGHISNRTFTYYSCQYKFGRTLTKFDRTNA